MSSSDIQTLLLVGMDLPALAKSARNAGYRVFAADFFGDLDLIRACDRYEAVIKQRSGLICGRIEDNFNPEVFVKLVKKLLVEDSADGILLSSGLDDSFDVLEELNSLVPIIGNSPETIRRVREKPRFFEELKRLGIAYPKSVVVEDLKEAERVAKDFDYPLVLKPLAGFAGVGIRKVESKYSLKRAFKIVSKHSEKVLIQQFIEGVHASVSFVSSSGNVKVLTVNKQLLGMRELGQCEPFGFCGNIVPLNISKSLFRKCEEIAKKLALHFDLRGSNGIDLVITEWEVPYVIEVNPRFQATLECVEKVLGLNLTQLHIKACIDNSLPKLPTKNLGYCTRLILYAHKRVKVPDLTFFEEARDIPLQGVIIEKGEPICSVFAQAKTFKASFKKAIKIAKLVYKSLS